MNGAGQSLAKRGYSSDDLCFGLLLLGLGALGFAVSATLPFGSAARMGPGFLPRLLCCLLVIIGAFNVARAFTVSADTAVPWAIRPVFGIVAGVAFFTYAVEGLGMVLTVAGTVLLGSLGDRNARPIETVLLAACVAAGCAALFVKALGIGIPIWPEV